MTVKLSIEHQKHLTGIKKRLDDAGWRESSFIKVELLFFEALDIARNYGNDEKENGLLASLKKVQSNQYEEANRPTAKVSERERRIRRFVAELRRILAS
jgi:hypothetical protein